MIIKSLGRKAGTRAYGRRSLRSVRGGARGSQSAFAALARYMNRDVATGEGRAILWHNFPGAREMGEDELIAEFERNAATLRTRRNGNVLYHEILSFSTGHALDTERLLRHLADIGQAYLQQRAPNQLAYGVVHHDTEYVHLHLMVSANTLDSSERVRLSKAEFAEVQRQVEVLVLARYPELQQTPIYEIERSRQRSAQRAEQVKATTTEQAMQQHRGAKTRKLDLAASLHQAFEQSQSFAEMTEWCRREGVRFYQRGKSVGIVVTEPDGAARKHRLATLGVLAHYEATNARLARSQERTADRSTTPEPPSRPKSPPQPERDQRTNPNPKPHATEHRSKEPEMPLPEKVIEVGQKVADAAERTTERTKAIFKEEARFGKEVAKDFVFGPDREDRRPNHEKPPEPKVARMPPEPLRQPEWRDIEPAPPSSSSVATPAQTPEPRSPREQMMDELRQTRERASDPDRSRDSGDRGDDR